MTDNEIVQNEEEIEINLGELFQLLKSRYKLIIISILVCAIIAGVITIFFISKKYESTARIYPKPEVTEGVVDYTQINANNLMVNNYVELLKGNNIQTQVAEKLDLTQPQVNSFVTISNETNTQIISITAKTNDPELSKKIVDQMVAVFKKEAKETLNINNITTVDQAVLAEAPVSPSLKMNLAIGALLGAFLSVGYLFIRFMLDTHVHNKEEAEKYLGIPCLGSIPYFED
ncbi:YveK family protein [Candidatus Stoquefichus sp. SB1]|jgi:capsular polysaccharide biosynthesis protein|uniref:YveK family protein n=1 Tax=Candidatus Stoquefichus sp. SB1 TaxID=1658109 RepID=UPI00067F146B|nr:Wzz/FepE/Etk N-terminal domain-containing protein [Candidatus Stoquefichus sp. SB1]